MYLSWQLIKRNSNSEGVMPLHSLNGSKKYYIYVFNNLLRGISMSKLGLNIGK